MSAIALKKKPSETIKVHEFVSSDKILVEKHVEVVKDRVSEIVDVLYKTMSEKEGKEQAARTIVDNIHQDWFAKQVLMCDKSLMENLTERKFKAIKMAMRKANTFQGIVRDLLSSGSATHGHWKSLSGVITS